MKQFLIVDEMMAEADENVGWDFLVINTTTGRAIDTFPTKAQAQAYIHWQLREPQNYGVIDFT